MNSYYPLALLLARQEQATLSKHLAHSALPTAPTLPDGKQQLRRRWLALRGRVATRLHRIAWAIEPLRH
ncbi:hypothetical protein [Paenarthrobacter aromaticivorans]|uniref:Uncharacterized protein n=1 Tax=Paenarthrobacter aromaticivorans TaxID=2849150 RepID=A0ABS6IAA5_9MICC|nr:hypothetical protein [Paenarthrobacter sp. MMS21-TAE1-1]MBU8867773.1 hypothetical protein [Paenarthrobacter sp. MMS21-TAE1-1]